MTLDVAIYFFPVFSSAITRLAEVYIIMTLTKLEFNTGAPQQLLPTRKEVMMYH